MYSKQHSFRTNAEETRVGKYSTYVEPHPKRSDTATHYYRLWSSWSQDSIVSYVAFLLFRKNGGTSHHSERAMALPNDRPNVAASSEGEE